jgi:general secretion pathway protein F
VPIYRYKAVTEPGEVLEGDMEAPSQAAVIEHLRNQGHFPIGAEEQRQGTLAGWLRRELGRGRRISRQDVAIVVRELATLLRAGLALDQALDVLIGFSEREAVREVLKRVVEKVRGGVSLADAMASQGKLFDRFCLGMIRAGEAGGSLEVVLAKTADYMERSQQSKQKVTSALIYPVILLFTAFASVAIVVTVVIPSFKEIFDQAGYDLPLATQVVVFVGDVAQRFWWLPVIVVLVAILAIKRYRRTPAGRRLWDRRMLQLPLLGELLTKVEVARMSYTLGMLLSNGVPLIASLSVVKETLGNAAMAHAFDQVEKQVKEGKTLAKPLEDSGLFPKLATHLLRIGEESGRLEEMMFRIGDTYDEDVQRTIQRLMTLLVPVLTFTMALLIAGIIVSILVPMLSINELAF